MASANPTTPNPSAAKIVTAHDAGVADQTLASPVPQIYSTLLSEQAQRWSSSESASPTSSQQLPVQAPSSHAPRSAVSSSSSPVIDSKTVAKAMHLGALPHTSSHPLAVNSHAATPNESDHADPLLVEDEEEPDYLKLILTARVYDVAVVTPLQHAPSLSTRLGRDNNILLKREDLQPVFSFKCRGAYNRMANLTDEEKLRGVIACSAGNHAQGVALAAQKMGIKAVIVMPTCTPAIKHKAVARMGGEVLLFGDDFDAAKNETLRLQKLHGYVNIPPFDDPYVIAGAGTTGLEVLRQTDMSKITAIFCCVGGGGLISGIASYVKRLRPEIKIIGVETHDANSLTVSLREGKRVELSEVGLFADGAAVKLVGKEPFRICQKLVDEMINVNNDEICAAIRDIFEDTRTVMEPAGALSVAGCKKYLQEHPELSGGVFVCVTSGANMNFDRLRFVSERAELGEQREALISVVIPEKPGSFMELYSVIDPRNITEFTYRYQNDVSARIFMSFTVLSPLDRERELKDIFSKLEEKGMIAKDLSENEMAKTHARYMVGGRGPSADENLLSFVFPERPGALKKYLNEMSSNWNISLWHYRNYGSDMAKVLVGMQVPTEDDEAFSMFLKRLKYPYTDESKNPVYAEFLC